MLNQWIGLEIQTKRLKSDSSAKNQYICEGVFTMYLNYKDTEKKFEGFDFLKLIAEAFKQDPNSEDYLNALAELTAKGIRQRAWLN